MKRGCTLVQPLLFCAVFNGFKSMNQAYVLQKCRCRYCNSLCTKAGKAKNNSQRLFCRQCKKHQMAEYANKACISDQINTSIIQLVKESCGIRSISRILKISSTTVIKRIKHIASNIQKPPVLMNKVFEMDELKTFVKHKQNEIWVIYAIDRESKQVADLKVGKRNKKNLKRVADTLLFAEAKAVYTDRLDIYRHILPKAIHKTKHHQINHIERKNLSLRTHLKRLGRKSICFSKSLAMLAATLVIYFWG